ncbi:MAG: type II toxin-antitoxin system mRNA interferase toxin, RelE/StbE family [Patescibacteria group bacterium]
MNGKKLRVDFSKVFNKQLGKAPLEIKIAFRERFKLFLLNPRDPKLGNHLLQGKLKGLRSLNITGDWRTIYLEQEGGKVIIFEALGTHSQLYR